MTGTIIPLGDGVHLTDSDRTASQAVDPPSGRSGAVDLSRAQLLELRNVLWSRDRAAWSEISDAVYPDGCTADEIRRALERAVELWREHMTDEVQTESFDTVVDDPDAGGAR